MKAIWYSRRTMVAIVGISCCTFIAINNKIDTSVAIASIAAALVGSNAYEGSKKP